MYLNGTNGIAVAHEVPTGIRFTVYDMPGFTGKPMTVNTVEQLKAYAKAFGISPGMALKHAVDTRRLDLPSAAKWSEMSVKFLVPKGGLAQTAPPQAVHQAPSLMWFYVQDGPPDKNTKAVIDSLEALSSYTVWVNAQIDQNVKLSQDALGHAKSKGWLDDIKYYSWIDFTYNPAKYSGQAAVPKPTWIEEILNAFKGQSGTGTNWVIIGGIAVVAIVAAVALTGRKPANVQPSQ